MTRASLSPVLGRFTIPCVALLLALTIFHVPSSEIVLGDDPAETREPIVVGPFKLGIWLDESKVKFRSDSDLFVPERKEIVKSLNECHAFVFDERIIVKGKGPRFGVPKLVVTGRLHHVFENKNDRYVIQIASLIVSPNMTDYSTKPAIRRVLVNVIVEAVESSRALNLKSRIGFSPDEFVGYDINGSAK
jgi:hypothetical protein